MNNLVRSLVIIPSRPFGCSLLRGDMHVTCVITKPGIVSGSIHPNWLIAEWRESMIRPLLIPGEDFDPDPEINEEEVYFVDME